MFRVVVVAVVSVALPLSSVPVAAFPQIEEQGTREKAPEETAGRPQVPWTEEYQRSLEGSIDPDTYTLGPYDELILILKGPETRIETLRVLPEGSVVLPNVGAFQAGGMTLTAFRTRVREVLGTYYRHVEIDCQLATPRTFVAYVHGEVARPQAVRVVAPFRTSFAIRAAGGITGRGSSRLIEIREEGRTVRTVDLFAFWRFGVKDQNPILSEGQMVYVPPRHAQVELIGEVRLPGFYEILPGETAADLIRYAGGFSSRGDSTRILLERVESGSQPLPALAFSSVEADSIALQDMDIVVVRDIMSFEANNPILVFGGGGRTGTIRVDREEPLREFLARLWRFSPDFDLESAVLERDVEGEPRLHIRFDVRDVIEGDPIGETRVQPGDIVMFPPFEKNVFVTGEVNNPGPVPFQAGYPVERYVSLAGGPSDEGSFDKIKIYSRDGKERGAQRNSAVYRGETIVVGRKTSRIISSAFVTLTTATSLILSIIALIRTD